MILFPSDRKRALPYPKLSHHSLENVSKILFAIVEQELTGKIVWIGQRLYFIKHSLNLADD